MKNHETVQLTPGEIVYNNRYGRMEVEQVLGNFGVKSKPITAPGKKQLEIDMGVAEISVLLEAYEIQYTPEFWRWFRDYRAVIYEWNDYNDFQLSLPESKWHVRPTLDVFICYLLGYSVWETFEQNCHSAHATGMNNFRRL